MVVAEIAKERLTDKAQVRCSELIAMKVPPEKAKAGKSVLGVNQRRRSQSGENHE